MEKKDADRIDNFDTLRTVILRDIDTVVYKRLQSMDREQFIRIYFYNWETKDIVRFFLKMIGDKKLHTAYEDEDGKLNRFI